MNARTLVIGTVTALLALLLTVTHSTGQCDPAPIASVGGVGGPLDMAPDGAFLYGAWGVDGLAILKKDETGQYHQIASLELGGSASNITIDANTAFVGTETAIHAVDISSPYWPVFLGTLDVDGQINGLKFRDGLLYLALSDDGGPGSAGLRIIDVSNPEAMFELTRVETTFDAASVAVSNGLCYLAGQTEGGLLLDVSTPSQPQVLFDDETVLIGNVVRMTGTRAYVGWGRYLRVLDISDPTSVSLLWLINLAQFSAGAIIYDMVPDNGVLYIRLVEPLPEDECGFDSFRTRLVAVDVSVPGIPVIVASDWIRSRDGSSSLAFSQGQLLVGVANGHRGIYQFTQDGNQFVLAGYDPFFSTLHDSFFGSMTVHDGVVVGLSSTRSLRNDGLNFVSSVNLALSREVHHTQTFDGYSGNQKLAVENDLGVTAIQLLNGPGGADCESDEEGFILKTIDLSDPLAPIVVGEMGFTFDRTLHDLAIEGGFAYIANGSFAGNLYVIDLADPAVPSLVTTATIPGEYFPYSMAILNGYAYLSVADRSFITQKLLVLDIADPFNPILVDEVDIQGVHIADMEISGDLLFAVGGGSFKIFNISNPADIAELYSVSVPNFTYWVRAEGGLVAIGGAQYTFLYDASDASSPVLLSTLEQPGPIAISEGGNGVLISTSQGLVEYQFPVRIEPVSTTPAADTSFSTTTVNDLSFVSDFTGGLRIYDVADPTNPFEVGAYDTPDRAYETVVVGNLAYVADGATGLVVLDVSDPTSPTLVGSLALSDLAIGLAVEGDFAYLATRFDGLQILDITNPASPVFVGSVDTPGSAQSVTLDGNLVYVADGSGGVQVIDVTARSSPTIIGSYNTPLSARQVLIRGLVAYVPDRTTGLIALGISDPTNPQLISTLPGLGDTRGVTAWGHLAFVADFAGFVHMVDIADPGNMQLVQTVASLGTPRAISSDGRTLYLADGDAGLTILDAQPCWYNPCPVDIIDDGLLDFFDLQAFLNVYSAGDGLADWNDDGQIDFFDLQRYLIDFSAGCP